MSLVRTEPLKNQRLDFRDERATRLRDMVKDGAAKLFAPLGGAVGATYQKMKAIFPTMPSVIEKFGCLLASHPERMKDMFLGSFGCNSIVL
jgi:hypothetical protein